MIKWRVCYQNIKKKFNVALKKFKKTKLITFNQKIKRFNQPLVQ